MWSGTDQNLALSLYINKTHNTYNLERFVHVEKQRTNDSGCVDARNPASFRCSVFGINSTTLYAYNVFTYAYIQVAAVGCKINECF